MAVAVVVLEEDDELVPLEGDDVVDIFVVFVVLLVSDFVAPPAGEGFTTVVLFSVLVPAGAPAGVTVSLFCSQAAKSAALARMQMYFFIVWMGCPLWVTAYSNGDSRPVLCK